MTLVLHILDITSLTLLRQMAALGLLGIWMELFNWLRLFDSSAQYVDLIKETIQDIGYFMLVFMELMLMFMVIFYMLQINRVD